ncbi:chloride channel CLIC-like protein 1 isoform 2-T2 [Rhinophrynus dorsalis]
MQLFLLLFFFLIPSHGQYHDSDDWIDPTDMLNYDAASGKMRNRPQNPTEEVVVEEASNGAVQAACLAERAECEKKVEKLKMQITESKKKEKLISSQSSSNPVFRRYLHKLINEAERLGLPDEFQSEVHYDAELVLTKQMLDEFQRFLSDADWNVGALDEALSGTLGRFKHHSAEEWRWKFEDSFGVDAYTLFMVLLCMLSVVLLIATELWTAIGWYTQIKRLLLLSILVGFCWNWLYLYKVAFAERQAEMAKMGTFDSECSKQISWSEGLFGWIKSSVVFQNDPCEEYYKTLLINPVLLVPPTKVLALTFTDFITEPLKHIGKGLGEFVNALLSEIPLFLQIPVLIFFAVALVALCYGTGTSVGQINRIRYLPNPERDRDLPIQPAAPSQIWLMDGRNLPNYVVGNQSQLEPRDLGRDHERPPINRRPENMRAVDFPEETEERIDKRPLPHLEEKPPSQEATERTKLQSAKNRLGEESLQNSKDPRSERRVEPCVETLSSNVATHTLPLKENGSGTEQKSNTESSPSNMKAEEGPKCNSNDNQTERSLGQDGGKVVDTITSHVSAD